MADDRGGLLAQTIPGTLTPPELDSDQNHWFGGVLGAMAGVAVAAGQEAAEAIGFGRLMLLAAPVGGWWAGVSGLGSWAGPTR